MKVTQCDNGTLTIEANQNKVGDYDDMIKVAELIASNNKGVIDIAMADDVSFVTLSQVWTSKGAEELKEEYKIAKKQYKEYCNLCKAL